MGVATVFDGRERSRTRGNIVAGTPGVQADLLSTVRSVGVGEDRLQPVLTPAAGRRRRGS
jgi:hypothetical protein